MQVVLFLINNVYLYANGSTVIYIDYLGLQACKGKWDRANWEKTGVSFGSGTTTQGKDKKPLFRNMPAYTCICYWRCIPCHGAYAYDPDGWRRLPTTAGMIFNDYTPNPNNKGVAGMGNQCFCPKPGPESCEDECSDN